MQGAPNDIGIIPQSCLEIFANKGDKRMFFTFIEIKAKETATDLISGNVITMKNDGGYCNIFHQALEETEIKEENLIIEVTLFITLSINLLNKF